MTNTVISRVAFAVATFLPVMGFSAELDAPAGPVLLTVSGAIENSNTSNGDAAFDREMLQALGAETIETTTIWTEGKQSFEGVSLQVLMDAVGATGSNLKATAINDYSVEIPAEDWVENGPIVAYSNNGEEMSVRDKGPLWVVYPYDSSPNYQTEVIYSRSIWQLDRIIVE